jgi:hypothetical protein
MVGDLVTHDLHDVVTVCDEAERQGSGENSQLPDGDGSLGLGGVSGGPGRVDDSPGTDSVTDIVGTVSERGSAGSENLDEGVGVLDLVGVLLSVAVDASHAGTLGSSVNTSLGSVNVVVDTVEAANHEHGRDTLEGDEHVLLFVDLTRADLVLVEVAHGPGEKTLLRAELGVEAFLALVDEFLVGELAVFGNDGSLLVVVSLLSHDTVVGLAVGIVLHVIVILNNGVIADASSLRSLRRGAAEEKRTLEDVVPADGVIALDDNGVEVGNEEDEREESKTNTAGDGDGSHIPRGLLVKTEVGRSLVDDGEGGDGTGDEEEEGSGPDGPWHGVLAHVDSDLDQHEDDGTEAGRGSGSHSKTSEDSTKTLALVPSPLHLLSTSDGDTDTSNRGDKRVGRRNVSGVLCAPHDPDGGTGKGAGEGKHLNTGVVLEGIRGNDTVLDGVGSTSTYGDGTDHLEDGTENHSLAVGNGARRDRSGPRVGDIVWWLLDRSQVVRYG